MKSVENKRFPGVGAVWRTVPALGFLLSSYYKVVVFIVPLQGLYAILFGDTVDWFSPPTT